MNHETLAAFGLGGGETLLLFFAVIPMLCLVAITWHVMCVRVELGEIRKLIERRQD